MSNPYDVVRQFEAALAEYTGAPYVVSTTSCTAALMLAVAWHLRDRDGYVTTDGIRVYELNPPAIEIPRLTYVGVAQSILNAGGRVSFRDEDWNGHYQLRPLPVWDSARLFTGGMWEFPWQGVNYRGPPNGYMMCLSFHHTKHLGISTHGGAILHDNPEADAWLRRSRYDGRAEGVAPKDDTGIIRGWHCYMTPPAAAEGLLRLSCLPRHNDPLPWGPGTNSDYADLSQMEIFK
jgi:dTDP-4-amino-4,6-dideoxygalactose transaminase